MTPKEAFALLNLNANEDLPEQLEAVFFEYKKKIYQQLDQVLLYPKWFLTLERLNLAALSLDFPFETTPANSSPIQFSFDVKHSLLAQFNAYQRLKSEVAFLVYNSSTPNHILTILRAFELVQKESIAFWTQARLNATEIKLSQQFDPLSILRALKTLEEQGSCYVSDLNEQNTPRLIQEWVAWNKAMQQKLASA